MGWLHVCKDPHQLMCSSAIQSHALYFWVPVDRNSFNARLDEECKSEGSSGFLVERTRLWRREVVDRNITFGAAIILIENVVLSFQTVIMIVQRQHWAMWAPYLLTYAVEWPALTFIIKYPKPLLYLAILGFDAIISLIAADPMTISNEPLDMSGYQVLYFDMIYVLMSVMYHPSSLTLTIFTLGRTLIFCVYYSIVLLGCGQHLGEGLMRKLALDLAVGSLALLVVNMIAIAQKRHLGKLQRTQTQVELKRRYVCSKMFNVFNFMVPPFLVKRILRYPGMVVAQRVERASILFIMLLDFEKHSKTMSPSKLFHFLNEAFTHIDVICAAHGVTKIETVGEEYVCGVGVSPCDVDEDNLEGHQHCLGRLLAVALELQRIPRSAEDNLVKMGIHTGPVVAGVVGKRLPRFRLFGDTMNMAARMMQKSLPGEVQFGEETMKYLPSWAEVKRRGYVEMKGKGNVMTYLLRGELPEELAGLEGARSGGEYLSIPTGILDGRSSPPENRTPERAYSLGCSTASPERSRQRAATEYAPPSPERRLDLRPKTEPQGSTISPQARSNDRKRSATPHRLAGLMKELLGMNDQMESDYDGEDILDVAREVTKQQSSQIMTLWGTSSSIRAFLRRLVDMKRWARPRSFPDSEDEDFQHWFHLNYTCHRIVKEFRKQALSSLLVTLGASVYVIFKKDGYESKEHFWIALDDIKWFLLCRLFIWILILSFWYAAETAYLMRMEACRAQALLSTVKHALGILICISYGALLKHIDHRVISNWSCLRFSIIGISNNILPLALFTEFCYWMTKAQTLFLPGVLGVIITVVVLIALAYKEVFYTGGLLTYLNVISLFNAFRIYSMEYVLRQRFIAMRRVEVMQERIEGILSTLMPPLVIEEIKQFAHFVSHHYSSATIAQSDLVGFTALASSREPEEVVKFISELFDKFDDLADQYHIYKVETVGDAYIAGQADFPLTKYNQPLLVVLFGLQMTMAARSWSAHRGESISCRVGVHTGECVGGMVGTSMQRYHLFGDLMRGLEILESTAPSGQVQVSRACKLAVETQIQQHPQEVADVMQHVVFQCRGEPVLTTSKGEHHDYSEVGGETYLARMRLVTFGPQSLEEQLAKARATFGNIPRGTCRTEAPSFESPEAFPQRSLQKMLRMQGMSTMPELHLVFPMANLQPWARNNPTVYLQHVLAYGGDNSLLLALRDRLGVASSVSVSAEDASAGSKVTVSMSLLPEGVEKLPVVLDAFFAFLNRARNSTLAQKSEVLRSLAETAQLGYDWAALEDATHAVYYMADDMTKFGPSELMVAGSLILEQDVQKVEALLERLRPERMNVVLVDGSNSEYWREPPDDARPRGVGTLRVDCAVLSLE
ncbi:unnamed protein product [Effrenium voratum]|nr:unnamed protein product [Effrenium voratum]